MALAHLRALVAAQPAGAGARAGGRPAAADRRCRRPRAGRERALVTLGGPRYLRLLDALYALVADPPLTERGGRAGRPGRSATPSARSGKRLRRRLDAPRRPAGDDGREALHEVRKAAKRVRYTAEVAGAELGDAGEGAGAGTKEVQKVLGRRAGHRRHPRATAAGWGWRPPPPGRTP